MAQASASTSTPIQPSTSTHCPGMYDSAAFAAQDPSAHFDRRAAWHQAKKEYKNQLKAAKCLAKGEQKLAKQMVKEVKHQVKQDLKALKRGEGSFSEKSSGAEDVAAATFHFDAMAQFNDHFRGMSVGDKKGAGKDATSGSESEEAFDFSQFPNRHFGHHHGRHFGHHGRFEFPGSRGGFGHRGGFGGSRGGGHHHHHQHHAHHSHGPFGFDGPHPFPPPPHHWHPHGEFPSEHGFGCRGGLGGHRGGLGGHRGGHHHHHPHAHHGHGPFGFHGPHPFPPPPHWHPHGEFEHGPEAAAADDSRTTDAASWREALWAARMHWKETKAQFKAQEKCERKAEKMEHKAAKHAGRHGSHHHHHHGHHRGPGPFRGRGWFGSFRGVAPCGCPFTHNPPAETEAPVAGPSGTLNSDEKKKQAAHDGDFEYVYNMEASEEEDEEREEVVPTYTPSEGGRSATVEPFVTGMEEENSNGFAVEKKDK